MPTTNKTFDNPDPCTSQSFMLSHIVPINILTRSGGGSGGGGGGGGSVIHANNNNDGNGNGCGGDYDDDDDVLGHKIIISVHRGKKTITKIEGIQDKFNLVKILKKLKSKDVLSCGGHIAKDKETGKDFIVVQGSYSTEITAFLTQEGIAEERFIIYRG
jgi:translation initiation factor 1 (eIF-1/SUI1)